MSSPLCPVLGSPDRHNAIADVQRLSTKHIPRPSLLAITYATDREHTLATRGVDVGEPPHRAVCDQLLPSSGKFGDDVIVTRPHVYPTPMLLFMFMLIAATTVRPRRAALPPARPSARSFANSSAVQRFSHFRIRTIDRAIERAIEPAIERSRERLSERSSDRSSNRSNERSSERAIA